MRARVKRGMDTFILSGKQFWMSITEGSQREAPHIYVSTGIKYITLHRDSIRLINKMFGSGR